MAEQDLFQGQDSGSIPTSPLQFNVKECSFGDISWIFKKYHYKGDHIGGGILTCFSLRHGMRILGGCVVGPLRQEQAYSKSGRKTIELRRMALVDEAPKNSESYFISKVIWYLKKSSDIEEVISYSDKSVGHVGTIYKASNFKLIGETAPSKHVFWNGKRYHPRSLTIDRDYSYKMRQDLKDGKAEIVTGEPKLIFSYIIKRIKS